MTKRRRRPGASSQQGSVNIGGQPAVYDLTTGRYEYVSPKDGHVGTIAHELGGVDEGHLTGKAATMNDPKWRS